MLVLASVLWKDKVRRVGDQFGGGEEPDSCIDCKLIDDNTQTCRRTSDARTPST